MSLFKADNNGDQLLSKKERELRLLTFFVKELTVVPE